MRYLLRYHRRAGLRFSRCGRHLDRHRPRSSAGAFGGNPNTPMIRVTLPPHLRKLAQVDGEITLAVTGAITQGSVLDALEARYPMLCGTVRDQVTRKRRPFVRFFACGQDLSHESPDPPLPNEIATGPEPFMIVGAIAGGR